MDRIMKVKNSMECDTARGNSATEMVGLMKEIGNLDICQVMDCCITLVGRKHTKEIG